MKTQFISYVKKAIFSLIAFIIPCVLLAQVETTPNDGLPTKRILDILIDGSDLWIAGDVGVIKYDKTTGEQIIYQPFTGEFQYSKTTLKLAKDHEKNIWATSVHHGIGKFDGRIWTLYSTEQTGFQFDQWNYDIVIDKDNNKWIGTYFYLVKSDNEKWEKWRPETLECEYTSLSFITAMALDHNEVLWVGGSSTCGTFGKFTGDGFEFYNTGEPPAPINHVTSIAVDGENDKWIGTTFDGFRKYDGQQFTSYTTENSDLPDNHVNDIKIDKDGHLWLACYKYLVKFDKKTFTKYEHSGFQSGIHCIAIEDNGDIWIGTHDDGLLLFSDGGFRSIELNFVSIAENDKPVKNEAFTVFAGASEVVIDFSLTESAHVSLSVFDMQGKEVCSILKNNNLISGKHQYSWNHAGNPNGLYLVRYVVNGTVNVKKVVIL